ncbi:unnamed protein product, partial [Rotaria sordida]
TPPIPTTSEFNNEYDQLRQDFENLTIQYKQLDEMNRSWQQNQLMILNDRFKLDNNNNNNLSFDDTIQQIENRFNNLQNQYDILVNRVIELQEISMNQTGDNNNIKTIENQRDNELQQLQEQIVVLTNQCAQFDEANRAWQQFQQAQLDNFRNKLRDHFPFDENLSFDQIAQLIINQIIKEREDFNQQYEILQKTNDELRSESEINLETIKESYINTINELNQELLIIKEELEKQTNTLNQQQPI